MTNPCRVRIAATVVLLLAFVPVVASAENAAGPAPAPAGDAAEPAMPSSLFPKAGAPDPRPFTLVDRYLDAAQRGDRRMLELCIEKGVDVHATDSVGRSALLMAVRHARSLELAKLLHAKGLPVDEADATGRTPLSDAAGNGDAAIVQWLLENGASVAQKDAQGRTPLFGAAIGGSAETVRRLIDAGAQVDVRDHYGDTPLMDACNRGHDDVARVLVEHGADPTLIDQEGRTAAQRAAEGAEFCRELSKREVAPPAH